MPGLTHIGRRDGAKVCLAAVSGELVGVSSGVRVGTGEATRTDPGAGFVAGAQDVVKAIASPARRIRRVTE